MAEAIATQQEKVAWYNLIGQFRQAAAQFEAMYKRLQARQAIAARHPELAKEYSALMNAGLALQKQIVEIRNKTAAVVDWLKGVFGFNGMGELGIVPLIPIAVVAVAVAAIGKWVKDAYVFSAKLDKVEALEKKGMPTAQAVQTVQKLTGSGPIFGLNPKWLVLLGVGLVAMPFIVPAVRRHGRKGGK